MTGTRAGTADEIGRHYGVTRDVVVQAIEGTWAGGDNTGNLVLECYCPGCAHQPVPMLNCGCHPLLRICSSQPESQGCKESSIWSSGTQKGGAAAAAACSSKADGCGSPVQGDLNAGQGCGRRQAEEEEEAAEQVNARELAVFDAHPCSTCCATALHNFASQVRHVRMQQPGSSNGPSILAVHAPKPLLPPPFFCLLPCCFLPPRSACRRRSVSSALAVLRASFSAAAACAFFALILS